MFVIWFLLKVTLVISCILLIIIVLLQQAKGGGLVGALGGLGSESALGTKAGTTAQKITVALAIVFIGLTILIGRCAPKVKTSVLDTTHQTHTPPPTLPVSGVEKPVSNKANEGGRTTKKETSGVPSEKSGTKANDTKSNPPSKKKGKAK